MTLRALGGGPLTGENLVRLVYIDESGISSRREEPILVVAGIIVHGDHQLSKVEHALDAILNKHIPEKDRYGFVLHSGDIYGGYGPYFDKRKNPEWADGERRWAILDDLAKIPEAANLRVVSAHVERNKFPQTFTLQPGEKPDLTVEAQVACFMTCALEVDMWMRENAKSEHCMLVVENNDNAKKLITATQRYHQDKHVLDRFTEKQREYFPLQKVKEDPAFQEKRSSSPLVLADFIAFTWKRKAMNDPHIDRFVKPWFSRSVCLTLALPE